MFLWNPYGRYFANKNALITRRAGNFLTILPRLGSDAYAYFPPLSNALPCTIYGSGPPATIGGAYLYNTNGNTIAENIQSAGERVAYTRRADGTNVSSRVDSSAVPGVSCTLSGKTSVRLLTRDDGDGPVTVTNGRYTTYPIGHLEVQDNFYMAMLFHGIAHDEALAREILEHGYALSPK